MVNIVQVVTLVSRDGAFGGPVSVAHAQTQELARRGHQVHLLAGWDGEGACAPLGVEVSLHRVRRVIPVTGFGALFAPSLVHEISRLASIVDVVHVHLARDLITLTAAQTTLRRKPRLVTQTHGMVMPDGRRIVRVIDAIATRHILRAACTVAALTEIEAQGLRAVAGESIRTQVLPNGIALDPRRGRSARPAAPVVLFCARLHPRKRVMAFAEMAAQMVETGTLAQFVIAGPDEGDLDRLKSYISAHQIQGRVEYIGALRPDTVRKTLANAAVFVLPSESEPFPMTLLEAMAEGTPSVVTEGCMIADRLGAADSVLVTDGSPAAMARAVGSLLEDRHLATALGARGRETIVDQYSIAAVVDQLEMMYEA